MDYIEKIETRKKEIKKFFDSMTISRSYDQTLAFYKMIVNYLIKEMIMSKHAEYCNYVYEGMVFKFADLPILDSINEEFFGKIRVLNNLK